MFLGHAPDYLTSLLTLVSHITSLSSWQLFCNYDLVMLNKFIQLELLLLLYSNKNTTKVLFTLPFRPLSEAFIRRSWY